MASMTHCLTRLALAAVAVVATAVSSTPAAQASAEKVAPRHVLPQKTHFDLQAHRGGIGMTTEEQPADFAKAIELGVTTLELMAERGMRLPKAYKAR